MPGSAGGGRADDVMLAHEAEPERSPGREQSWRLAGTAGALVLSRQSRGSKGKGRVLLWVACLFRRISSF